MAISVIMPVYYSPPTFYVVHPITGIMVLTNAVLFAMAVPLYNALSNLVRAARRERIFEGFDEVLWRKVLACFVGTPSNKQETYYHSVMERSTGEGKKRFSFRLNYDDRGSSDKSCYSGLTTDDRIWLSQNLPFLVFMLAGFLATVLFLGRVVIANALILAINVGGYRGYLTKQPDMWSQEFYFLLSFVVSASFNCFNA